MKHRHTFFLDPSKASSPDAFELIPGNKKASGGLKIRNLHASREWKITIPAEDLASKVPSRRRKQINFERAKQLSQAGMTIQYVTRHAKNIREPLQRGFVQGFHVLWQGSSYLLSKLLLTAIEKMLLSCHFWETFCLLQFQKPFPYLVVFHIFTLIIFLQ